MRLVNQSVNRIWDDYDRSKDGYLTFEESHDFIQDSFGNISSKKFTEDDIREMFNRMDTDGDGKINKGEMASFLLKLSKF